MFFSPIQHCHTPERESSHDFSIWFYGRHSKIVLPVPTNAGIYPPSGLQCDIGEWLRLLFVPFQHLRQVEFHAAGQNTRVVAPFKHADDTSRAVLVGDVEYDLGEGDEILSLQTE